MDWVFGMDSHQHRSRWPELFQFPFGMKKAHALPTHQKSNENDDLHGDQMIAIRNDISAGDLRRAVKTVDGFAARRLFALANVLDGMTRTEAARQADIARASVVKGICVFNAKGIKGLLEVSRRGTKACPMRDDIPARDLRQAAKTMDNRTARRYLALADVLDGMLRKDAAKAADMSRNALRRWILRFNADGLEGLQECRPGQRRASALRIRDDISARDLRRTAKTVDRRVKQRFLAIADVLDGMDRKDAAAKAGASPLTMADWIRQFNAGGLEGLQDLSLQPPLWSTNSSKPETSGVCNACKNSSPARSS